MKKRFLSIALAGALAATALVGCGKKEEPSSGENNNKPNTEVTGGSVYYLNFKPEQDLAWQRMAEIYQEKTGTKVTVITAAAGKYESTLAAEIDKANAPTLFQVNGPVGLANWSDYCYDLKDSTVYKELTSDSFALKDGDAVLGVSYVIESYGLITNTKLLDKAGYKVSDIKSFADLKKVAEDIHKRADELGFDAFTASDMDGSSSWRFTGHMANLEYYYESKEAGGWKECPPELTGKYMENFKNLYDLCINNSMTPAKELATGGHDAQNQFKTGKAAFYVNGSWEYSAVAEAVPNATMIPYYAGVKGEEKAGLNCGTENYWAINGKASEADIQATMDFLVWLLNCWGIVPLTDMLSCINTEMIADTDTPENREQAYYDMAMLTEEMIMRNRTHGGYKVLLDDLFEFVEEFNADMIILWEHITCKALDGMHGLFEDKARERGIPLIWVDHQLFDPRVISRQGVRDQVNQYMRTVMGEEPLDPLTIPDNVWIVFKEGSWPGAGLKIIVR